MRNVGSDVFEIALPFKVDAFRVVYAVQLGNEIRVVHASRRNQRRVLKLRNARSM
jgi:hypothetical protein